MGRAKRKRVNALHRRHRRRRARLEQLAGDFLFSPFGMAAVSAFVFNKVQEFAPPSEKLRAALARAKKRAKEQATKKPYVAPEIITIEPGPLTTELLEKLEASGMRRLNCEGCGCEMLTRSTSNKCPPCRGTVPSPEPAI